MLMSMPSNISMSMLIQSQSPSNPHPIPIQSPSQVGETILRCGDPELVLEVVCECQRRLTPMNDFSALLPTDFHGEWSDEKMERKARTWCSGIYGVWWGRVGQSGA